LSPCGTTLHGCKKPTTEAETAMATKTETAASTVQAETRYEAPAITTLGTLAELTLGTRNYVRADGMYNCGFSKT
jgi:hypothetical protein